MNNENKPTSIEDANPSRSYYFERQEKLFALLEKSGFQALALNPGPSLVYLTGLHFHLMERPTVALLIPNSPLKLIIPELEIRKVDSVPYDFEIFSYGDDPKTWQKVFNAAFDSIESKISKFGVEPSQLRFLELRFFETAAKDANFISAQDLLSELRIYKTSEEISSMRKAVDIAQKALLSTLDRVKVGITEREIASELTVHLLRNGSNPDLPFYPIVSGGPHSANPHASPTDRPLQKGDLLLIDWGANYKGYMSDITRTFAVGEIEPEFAHIAEVVSKSNKMGRAASKPGTPAGKVDQAARGVIEAAGYGEFFTHRTGHGLGMEGHEAPYIYTTNERTLQPGMTFTVEPGIYLQNQGGVRIEDDILITESGAESLTDLPRDLRIIDG